MSVDHGDGVRDQQALVATLDAALAGFRDEDRAATHEAVDERWLGIGTEGGGPNRLPPADHRS